MNGGNILFLVCLLRKQTFFYQQKEPSELSGIPVFVLQTTEVSGELYRNS